MGTNGAVRRFGSEAGAAAAAGLHRSQHGVRMSSEAKTVTGMRVLVVEDELMIRMLLDGMLTDLGHTVAGEAGSIEEALTLAKEGELTSPCLTSISTASRSTRWSRF